MNTDNIEDALDERQHNMKRQKAFDAREWPLDQIIPYERNPRSHPESQVALLAQLIDKYGVDQPIVVDEKGVILKGHGRLLAARKLGRATFPVVAHIGLSNDDKKAIRIADNQVALLSGWDEELLKLELKELQAHGFDLPMLGFPESKFDAIFDNLSANGESQLAGLKFAVIIECKGEKQQTELLQQFAKKGFKCRALIS